VRGTRLWVSLILDFLAAGSRVSIDMERQEAKYGVDFRVIDLSPYFRATIDQLIANGFMVPPKVAPLSLKELL